MFHPSGHRNAVGAILLIDTLNLSAGWEVRMLAA